MLAMHFSGQIKRCLQAGVDFLHQPRRHLADDTVDAVAEDGGQEEATYQRVLIQPSRFSFGCRYVDKYESRVIGRIQVRRNFRDERVADLCIVCVRLHDQRRSLLTPHPARMRKPGHNDITTIQFHAFFP